MPMQDQVVWASVNATVDGAMTPFTRGALLPDPVSSDESAERSLLRIGGALRTVEVVYTPEELAEQANARATATSAREVAADVDPAATAGNQTAGAGEPGPPTLHTGGGAPVVIGKDTKSSAPRPVAGGSPPPKRSDRLWLFRSLISASPNLGATFPLVVFSPVTFTGRCCPPLPLTRI